jgi:hypothetical protein
VSRWPFARSEAGDTLAGVLVALVILTTAGVAIMAGMAAASIASDTHRKGVNADTVVRSYAEVIKGRALLGDYIPCNAPAAYEVPPASTWTAPPGYSAIFDVSKPPQYWHTSGGFSPSACTSDDGAQLISLIVMSLDGRDSESIQVIIRTP